MKVRAFRRFTRVHQAVYPMEQYTYNMVYGKNDLTWIVSSTDVSRNMYKFKQCSNMQGNFFPCEDEVPLKRSYLAYLQYMQNFPYISKLAMKLQLHNHYPHFLNLKQSLRLSFDCFTQ